MYTLMIDNNVVIERLNKLPKLHIELVFYIVRKLKIICCTN